VSRRFSVVWSDAAARDYEALLTYVAAPSGVLRARQLDDKLFRSISRLDTLPARCRVVPELREQGIDVYRELVIRPYRIMFRIRDTEAVLLAVVDGRRDLQELLLQRALGDL
jgi:toxin ParE1/3/4